jgi:hypothetical protein
MLSKNQKKNTSLRSKIIYFTFMKIICLFTILILACTTSKPEGETTIQNRPPKGYIPTYALNYIDSIKQANKSFYEYKFYYDKKENAHVDILLINTRDPRKKIKMQRTWTTQNGEIGRGEIKYSQTRKKRDLAQWKMEQRRKDPVFEEIEKVIFQIATEYNYDWLKAYGIEVSYRNPNVKKGVCNDYANAVSDYLKEHEAVEHIEKWTGGNHAWNVIILKDGRKLYTDATWYQTQNIDNDNYVSTTIDKDPTNLTFDIEEFNSHGNAINISTGEILKTHFAWEDSKLAE